MEVIIRPTTAAAVELTAEVIARELRANPRMVLGLATGCTMEAVYARLVWMYRRKGLDFSSCHTFNLDEYVGLAASDPHSYHYYMKQHLFGKVNIDLRRTHLPDGLATNLKTECANYEKLIKRRGGIDLQLLGIGLNGHLGFNEPPSAFNSRTRIKVLSKTTREQNALLFPSPDRVPRRAITVGVRTILEARHCLLLATGEDKAVIVARAIEGAVTRKVPASALQLHPHSTIILDEAAGGQLKELDYYRSVFERELKWKAFRRVAPASRNNANQEKRPVGKFLEPAA
jgi:glucosamine-6-phosphate deaminase